MIGGPKGVGLVPGVGGLGMLSHEDLAELLGEPTSRRARTEKLRAVAAEKIKQGAPLTREEAAAFLGVSPKKLYRLEVKKKLRCCSVRSREVLYPPGEVLRLASAARREA